MESASSPFSRLATKKPWAIDVSYFTPAKRPLYLTGMAVSVAHQGEGLGAYDAKAGVGSFYAKCGFQERGRVVYKDDPLVYYELLTATSPPRK